MLLVLLQNGWSSYYTRIGRPGEVHDKESYFLAVKGKVWPRESWLRATWSAKTGIVLDHILKLANINRDDIWIDDTTLALARVSSGVLPPDIEHVRSTIRDRGITSVLACGKQAGKVIDEVWDGHSVKMCHPAYRGLTDAGIQGTSSALIHMIMESTSPFGRYKVSVDFHTGQITSPAAGAGRLNCP